MKSLISILVTLLLVSKNAAAGEVHSTVQTLTNTDFQEALNDPANGEFFSTLFSQRQHTEPTPQWHVPSQRTTSFTYQSLYKH